MLFGGEKRLRMAANKDWTVIVKEIGRNDKVYCRLHIDFEDSNNIHDVSFEDLCKKYGATEQNVRIEKVVSKVVRIYMKEDYEYVVSLVRSGKTAEKAVSTVDEEMEFIKRNGLDMGLSDEDLRVASEEILERIADIDKRILTENSR